MKISTNGIKARDKAIAGANYLADTVKATLGPFGSDALLEHGNKITNDGYTIAQAVAPTLEDEFERRGALVFLQASAKTNDQVGDATTTSMVLAQAILKEAVRYLPQEGVIGSKKTASELKKQLQDEKEQAIEYLKEHSEQVTSKEQLVQSALVSVEYSELAEMIGETQWELGEDGVIVCEDTAEYVSSIERIRGLKLDNGFATPTVVNNQEKGTLELENCSVILTNYAFHEDNKNFEKIKPLVEQLVLSGKREIILFGKAFSSQIVLSCVEALRNGVAIYPMNAPYVNQKEVFKDIQSITGGRFVEVEETRLEDLSLSDVGTVSKFQAGLYGTFIAGEHDPENRVKELELQLKGEVSEFHKKALTTRISQLKNGCALLKIGAKTELERKRLKDKADDAVNAVRLALKGGTIKGAGIALKEAGESLGENSILSRPLAVIHNQIMASAPKDFEVAEWVRDPYLVIESALNNAVSVASIFANVNAIVTEKDEKKVYVEGSSA